MAVLRPVEDRDAKGITIRVNPSITFKADPQIRRIVGRHDWQLVDNPDYHQPITAQVQGAKILFFLGVPDNSMTRAAAKEMDVKDVPKYIIDTLKRSPIKVREPRPTVYEVKLATIGDVEVPTVSEMDSEGASSITVSPVEPELLPKDQRKATAAPVEANL